MDNVEEVVEALSKVAKREYEHFLCGWPYRRVQHARINRDAILLNNNLYDAGDEELALILKEHGYFFHRHPQNIDNKCVRSTYLAKNVSQGEFIDGNKRVPYFWCRQQADNFSGVDYIGSIMGSTPNIITENSDFVLINEDMIAETFDKILANIPYIEKQANREKTKGTYTVLSEFLSGLPTVDQQTAKDTFVEEYIKSNGTRHRHLNNALYDYSKNVLGPKRYKTIINDGIK